MSEIQNDRGIILSLSRFTFTKTKENQDNLKEIDAFEILKSIIELIVLIIIWVLINIKDDCQGKYLSKYENVFCSFALLYFVIKSIAYCLLQ